jgi:serine/threonine protein phosphatase PrpC
MMDIKKDGDGNNIKKNLEEFDKKRILKATKTDRISDLIFAQSSMQGCRSEMEDKHSFKFSPDLGFYFFGIFDGHGGTQAADYASEHLFKNIEKNLLNDLTVEDKHMIRKLKQSTEDIKLLAETHEKIRDCIIQGKKKRSVFLKF